MTAPAGCGLCARNVKQAYETSVRQLQWVGEKHAGGEDEENAPVEPALGWSLRSASQI